MLHSSDLDVISVYRSIDNKTSINHLSNLICHKKAILICGDFNFCYIDQKRNSIAQFLNNSGFSQHVLHATHLEGGHLDQVYFRDQSKTRIIDVLMYSPYYTAKDHDALLVTVLKEATESSGSD